MDHPPATHIFRLQSARGIRAGQACVAPFWIVTAPPVPRWDARRRRIVWQVVCRRVGA